MSGIIPKEILEKLGIASPSSKKPAPTTPEERKEQDRLDAQAKCDSYNASTGNLNEEDGYDCPNCKNKGYIAYVRYYEQFGYYYESYANCECLKVRKMIKRLERSGLKNIIRDYTFKRYEATDEWQTKLKQAAMQFVKDEDHNWFFIGGMSGCGKTHLCTAIAGYYLKHDKEVRYMLWRDEVVSLKANVNNAEEYAHAIKELKETPVLYIDDLFKTGKDKETGRPQMPTAADVNIAFEVINYRYNNPQLVTIISSERTIMDLVDIDEALAGRIAEKTLQFGYGFNIKHDPKKNHRLKGYAEM